MKQEPNARPESGNSTDINVYGVFDNLSRQLGQYQDKGLAEAMIVGKKGWSVRPILICQANTAYSIIHHGSGAERELHDRYGLRSDQILPDVVAAFRNSASGGLSGFHSDESEDW